jgi:hypothetical protein
MIRDEIVARTAEHQGELREQKERAGKLVETLSRAYERESGLRAQTGQVMPDPIFTRDELDRIADNAATTRDAAMLLKSHEFERRFNTYVT